jgi:hypothetical protein
MIEETQFVERLQFFNGQRLFAEDVQGIEQFNREMRWLHNRSLHQPGIGNGYSVSGNMGDREVTIGPGYAIDSLGREIVLNQSHVEPVPPVSSDKGETALYDLVVSYPEDSALDETETRQGVCLPRGSVRLQEAPVFCWVRLERKEKGQPDAKDPKLRSEITRHIRIRLARIEVMNCQLAKCVSLAERGSARPECRPYIGCGREPVTARKDIDLPPNDQFGGAAAFIVTVDTSAAGFVTIPTYTAHIEGPRTFMSDGQLIAASLQTGVFNPSKDEFSMFVYVRREIIDVILIGVIGGNVATGGTAAEGDTGTTGEGAGGDVVVEIGTVPPAGEVGGTEAASAANAAVLDEFMKEWTVVWIGVEG